MDNTRHSTLGHATYIRPTLDHRNIHPDPRGREHSPKYKPVATDQARSFSALPKTHTAI